MQEGDLQSRAQTSLAAEFRDFGLRVYEFRGSEFRGLGFDGLFFGFTSCILTSAVLKLKRRKSTPVNPTLAIPDHHDDSGGPCKPQNPKLLKLWTFEAPNFKSPKP